MKHIEDVRPTAEECNTYCGLNGNAHCEAVEGGWQCLCDGFFVTSIGGHNEGATCIGMCRCITATNVL